MESSSHPRPLVSLLSCFGKCFRNGSGLEQEQECFDSTITRKRSCDAETERRIKEWIIDSSLCYDQTPDSTCQTADSISLTFDISGGLENTESGASTQSDQPLLPAKVSLETVNNKERNKNRWKGRMPTVPAETLSIAIPTDEAQDARVKHPTQPHSRAIAQQSQRSPCNSTACLVPSSSSAARVVSTGRVIWMRRTALMQGRRRSSSRIAAQPSIASSPLQGSR
jgi:hypothetical protein